MSESPATDNIEQYGYKQELHRSLSFTDLLVYGLVFMVPIAPFGIFGGVFQGSGGMVALAYAIGMVAMMFTALSYAQMSRAFPMAGSVYTYAGRGIAAPVGFLSGWMILLDYVLVPALLYLIAAIAMNSLMSAVPVWIWLIGFVILNTVVNYMGIEMTAKVNKVMLVGELIVLAIFIVIGVVALAQGKGRGFDFSPIYNADTFSLVSGVRRGLDRGAVLPRVRRHLHARRGEQGDRARDRPLHGRRAAGRRCAVHRADLGRRPAGPEPGHADQRGRPGRNGVLRRGRRRGWSLAVQAHGAGHRDRLGLRERAGRPGGHVPAALRDGARPAAARASWRKYPPEEGRPGQRHAAGGRRLAGARRCTSTAVRRHRACSPRW